MEVWTICGAAFRIISLRDFDPVKLLLVCDVNGGLVTRSDTQFVEARFVAIWTV